MTDMHRFRDIWRTEINDNRARTFSLVVKEMFTAGGCFQHTFQSGGTKPEIKEASPSDFDAFAPFADVQPGQHARGKLARVQLPLLRQGYQNVGLVIAEFRVGARPNDSVG